MSSSTARAAIDVGSVIADTYVLEALIGRGGMGAVYSASHTRLPGKKVAVKLLHAELDDPEVLRRFKREAHIASQLNHPNIVTVTDYNVTPEGMPYLVLEYLHGETLAQRLLAGPMPIDSVMSIVRQVGSALAAAHREGIVHRDLKPQNIFLVPTEVDGRVIEVAKVLDFGISKMRDSDTVKTQDSTLLGTPQYMAPEQATGQHSLVDQRTDVFAFGAMVYEMLAGHPAFAGASIPEVVFKVVYEQPAPLVAGTLGIAPAIVTAIGQAMAKHADQRFANVSAFVEAMTGAPLPTAVRPVTAPPPVVGWPSGSRRDDHHVALAQTQTSGEHAHVVASASTVASLAKTPVAAPPAVTVPTGTTMQQPRRRRLLVALLAIGCLAAAAITFVIVRRDRGHPRASPIAKVVTPVPADAAQVSYYRAPAADARVDVVPPPVVPHDAGHVVTPVAVAHDAAVVAVVPRDAATAVAPAKPDAAVAVAVPVRGAPHEGDDDVDSPQSGDNSDATEIARLDGADQSLSRGDDKGAMYAANTALSNAHSLKVKRRAEMVRAVVFCRQSNQERASSAFRAAGAHWRGRIEQACAQTETHLPLR